MFLNYLLIPGGIWVYCLMLFYIYEPRLFYFLFLNLYITINSFCLIALASTYSMMLNWSSERGQICLVPDLRGKTSSFHH